MAVQPKLRFKGFTDDWEKRQLGNVSNSYSGGTPSASRTDYYGGKIPFIRSAEINSNSTELYLTESGFKNSSAKMVQLGDILYALYGATSGEVGISKINGAINQAILTIKPTEGDNAQFIMQWLKGRKGHIVNTYLQGGQGNLSGSIIKNLEIMIPDDKKEEIKIGEFLQSIDNLITVNQRKVNLLKKKKTAYLQKLFPKTGSNIPELRFKGYIDAWEKRQLDDVVEKQIKGKAQLKKLNAGKVEYLDTVRLNGGSPILTDGIQDVSQDDILILWDGSKAGTVYSGFEGTLGSTLKAYRTSVNSQFVYQFLRLHQKNIYSNYRTPNIPHVQKDFLNVFKIDIPRFEEQRKIGDFLSSLDNLITVNQRLNQKSIILLSNYIYAVKKPPELTDDLHLLFICIIFCYLYNVLDYYKLQNNKL